MSQITRRSALTLVAALAPLSAFAAKRRDGYAEPRGGVFVDVNPLRRTGDNTDADFLADYLPGYIAQQFGPGHKVAVRIDSVSFGTPGSNGASGNNGAVDTIEGVGRVDGREIPVQSSIQTIVSLPDVGGYAARQRQLLLAQSFAQWLQRESGSWR